MHYLFLGEDNLSKNTQIDLVKPKILPTDPNGVILPEAASFDYQTLYAEKLTAEDFKKALVTLPVVAKQRLIIIRNTNKLSKYNKDLILDFLNEDGAYVSIIFDITESDLQNNFLKKLAKFGKVSLGAKVARNNVFDMTNAIMARDASGALGRLNELMDKGDHPLQIMGGLVWFWGNNKNRLSKDQFHKGLKYLQEADLNIKRTRLNPQNAVEVAVTKLCSLLAC